MKLSPATILILTMFGSFAIILTTMIVLFRPEPRPAPRRPKRTQAPKERPTEKTAPPDTESLATPSTKTAPPDTEAAPSKQAAVGPRPQQPPAPRSDVDSRAYRKLRQERKEMALFKAEMEKRLKKQLETRKRKFAQLARQCERLEPGEAVQILLELEDEPLAEVLRRMDRDKAIKVAALLKRLGREKAIALQ